ncbi:PREDICTED: uncharacterized protein LOC104824274 [Tarenaya hassleriana]|uniref:uncharacterized protein LOC104824274 n=1 Tax=Tarenaya hassleriana TaxID=28532 RepID=UPI00053C0D0D|nr:PREDICTED: uncharacterized protein LOC104824274 [Tarenaya hassleriana]
MEEREKKKKKNTMNKKQKHNHYQTKPTSDISFKPYSDVKGLRFGGQIIVNSFTIRRAPSLELLKLLSLHPPPTNKTLQISPELLSVTAYIPTNFTILAHHAWHTLTLGLGTRKSKVVVFVFESETMKKAVELTWQPEIPLGNVNKKMIRGLKGCEMARFKFRKGCVTFYVYGVRNAGNNGFAAAEDLKVILQSVVALNDFLDHTAMLALPHQRCLQYNSCPRSLIA